MKKAFRPEKRLPLPMHVVDFVRKRFIRFSFSFRKVFTWWWLIRINLPTINHIYTNTLATHSVKLFFFCAFIYFTQNKLQREYYISIVNIWIYDRYPIRWRHNRKHQTKSIKPKASSQNVFIVVITFNGQNGWKCEQNKGKKSSTNDKTTIN